jgi:hypothetical protein
MKKKVWIKGPRFGRLGSEMDYHRLGEEVWQKLSDGEAVECSPSQELIDKEYVVKEKPKKKEVN